MPRAQVSAQIAAAAVAAAMIGLLDAGLVSAHVAGAGGAFQFVPARIWIVAPAVWMAAAAVLCAALLPLMPRWGGVAVPAAVGTVFLVLRLLSHPLLLAAALIAFAAAVIVTRRRMLLWTMRPRRVLATAVAGAIGVATAIAVAQALRPATLPPPRDASGPNVIVVFLDTVRYDAVFDAGGRVAHPLPALARLSRESTVFTRAYSTSPWTLPAHLSAFTGLPPHQLGVSFDAQTYRRSDPTLAERFRRRGYRTAAVISNSFLNEGTGFARGFDTFQQAHAGLDLCRTAPGPIADAHWPWFGAAVCNWSASEVTRRALALMDDAGGPFFLTINYMDAHDPYYVERACGGHRGYEAALRCLDRSLAAIVDWRSTRRPTVLVVAGDHGEQFGEHGRWGHGNSLYVQLLHVPLVVRAGDAGEAKTVADPVSIAALPSLLLDSPGRTPAAQTPLRAVLHPPASSKLPSQWSALDGEWHLITGEGRPDAIFHLPSDPAEEHDVAATAHADAAIARLRAAIADMRREPKPDTSRFRSLGYVQ